MALTDMSAKKVSFFGRLTLEEVIKSLLKKIEKQNATITLQARNDKDIRK